MVAPIPDWLIDQARGVQEAVRMDQTCTIKRRVKVSNSAGGKTAGTVTTLGPYHCAVGPSTAATGEILAQRKIVVTGREQIVTLPVGTTVLITDRIAITGGDEFEVVYVPPATRRQTAMEVIVRRQE